MPDAGSSSLFERKKIEIAGIELEVHEAGDGPPLLYLHAGGGFRTAHPAMPLLAERHLLSMVQAGHLSHEDTCKSLRLMATELSPRLRELGKLTSIAAA